MGKISKLKLKDFKSFRNTVIPFVGGFTSVVGPNGSGKSNILDAINFALGAPSMKTLRAGRLTDLVHHKSNSGSAEVMIELKTNGEKHEIARSIDKEGTSVFRLDKKRTTRSEITEFLASMNINPQARNIIMQGEVSEIIHMTPMQRREVIDEVSGIAEYNDKKDKALRELEKVEEKTKEANIILYERTGYLGELRKERDQASRYKKHDNRKKLLAKAVVVRELEEIEVKLDKTLKKKIALEKELEQIDEKNNELNAQLINWGNKKDALNNELQEKGGTEQIEINKRIERAKNEVVLLEEKKKLKEEELDKTERDALEKREKLESLEEELRERKTSTKKLERDKKAYEKRLEGEQGNFDEFMAGMKGGATGELNVQVEQLTTELDEKKREFYETKGIVDQTRERIGHKKLSISEAGKEKKSTIQKTKEEKKRLEKILEETRNKKKKKRTMEERIAELEELRKGLKKKKEELETKLGETRKEYHSLESRLTTLKQLTGNKASNAVVAASGEGELTGIVGRVEDLCKFSPKYASAVQAAGGPMLNFVVTLDIQSATKAIKWLKKKKLGRTTFIPLNAIKTEQANLKKLLEHPKVVDSLINLVEFEEAGRPALEYVFGDTLIIKDLDSVEEIGVHKARLVTLDGELTEPSGAITGGFEHGIDLAGEMNHIQDLQKSMQMLENQKKQLESMNVEEELEELVRDKAAIELELREAGAVTNGLEEKMAETEEIEESKASRLAEVERGIEELKNVLIEKEKDLKEKSTEIKTLEKKREMAKEKAEAPEVKKLSERVEKQQRIVATIKDQLSELTIQANQVNSEANMLEERTKSLEEELGEIGGNGLKQAIKDFDKRIGEKRKEVEKSLEEEKKISIVTKELIEKRENFEAQIRELAEQRGELRRKLETKKEEIGQEEIEKAKLETRYTAFKQELGIDPTEQELEKIREVKDDILTMKREIEDLEQRMIRLEPVNLKAIQAYDEFLGEVDLIKERVSLLEKEKEAVIDLMEEIEGRRKYIFIEAFELVNDHFGRVYKEFYPEAENARAGIKLENAEDPFQGGLHIEAKPAGKETKTIDELSTGEKTLAAIAFLFALQEYKPSPFYILDESDSALDKTNSERLAQMIQKRAKDTQFITITHNNPLMHYSDQIVGVSMNKKAGSSVVEVDLKNMIK